MIYSPELIGEDKTSLEFSNCDQDNMSLHFTNELRINKLSFQKCEGVKGIAEDHRFDCLRTLSSSAWKELATCQFENIEIVNFEKFKVK